MLAAVKGGYELVTNVVEYEGAYRAKDKDLLRALARDLEQKDPWVLLSRPMKEADGFVEQRDVYKRQVEILSGYGAHLGLKLLTERHGKAGQRV